MEKELIDPIEFCKEYFQLELKPDQADILRKVVANGVHVYTHMGPQRGATTMLAAACLWFLYSLEDVQVVTVSGVDDWNRLLWIRIHELLSYCKKDLPGIIGKEYIMLHSRSCASAVTGSAYPSMQGYNHNNVIFLIDGDQGLPEETFQTMRSYRDSVRVISVNKS